MSQRPDTDRAHSAAPQAHAHTSKPCPMTGASVLLACALMAGQALAQDVPPVPLPSPFEFATQLDLECRKAAGPPPDQSVFIRQLNPVLTDKLPNQWVELGPLERVCVPVVKDHEVHSQLALQFARWTDLACFQAKAAPVDVRVKLSHINPVLADLPDEQVRLVELKELCLPVRKNDSDIPTPVRDLVRHLDLACYAFDEPTAPADQPLLLTHINPVIRELGFDDHKVRLQRANQLCVPVGKNDQPIPEAALRIVRWVDMLKYQAELPPLAPVPPDFGLKLTHMNPLYQGKWFNTVLQRPIQVMVPVAKDDHLPPQD